MPVVTEVRGETQVDLVAEYAVILQLGASGLMIEVHYNPKEALVDGLDR